MKALPRGAEWACCELVAVLPSKDVKKLATKGALATFVGKGACWLAPGSVLPEKIEKLASLGEAEIAWLPAWGEPLNVRVRVE